MNPITVLLAEDHMIVREGLRALLRLESDIEVVGEAENGQQAVAYARQLCPDIIVMDIAMPLLNGLDATRLILEASPSAKVIVLSAHGDKAYIEQAKAIGAAGYLLKQTAGNALPRAIRAVHSGKSFVSPARANTLQYP